MLAGWVVNSEMGRRGKFGFYFAGGEEFSESWKNYLLKWW